MKNKLLTLLIFLSVPLLSIGQKTKTDSLIFEIQSEIEKLKQNDLIIDSLKTELNRLQSKHELQLRISEQTLNSISNQIGATSFNLTVFGILFAIAALGLGIYVTYIERKTTNIREQTKDLLNEAIKTKNEVESINNLIQKDINGLFVKIKREETVYILNRLLKVPRDIGNLMNELLSRELEKSDFDTLKKAYLKLPSKETKLVGMQIGLEDRDKYKLLFFQHFLDLSIKDDTVGPDLIDFYPNAILCAFENDILKSTEDFAKAIVDKGFQNCDVEINSFFGGLAKSEYQSLTNVYKIVFNRLKNRDDRFKLFDLLSNEKEIRVVKVNYGGLLIDEYSETELTESEKIAIERTLELKNEITEEEQRQKEANEKRKKALEEKKRVQEEKRKTKGQ